LYEKGTSPAGGGVKVKGWWVTGCCPAGTGTSGGGGGGVGLLYSAKAEVYCAIDVNSRSAN